MNHSRPTFIPISIYEYQYTDLPVLGTCCDAYRDATLDGMRIFTDLVANPPERNIRSYP